MTAAFGWSVMRTNSIESPSDRRRSIIDSIPAVPLACGFDGQ
jgi:hypothetical protein